MIFGVVKYALSTGRNSTKSFKRGEYGPKFRTNFFKKKIPRNFYPPPGSSEAIAQPFPNPGRPPSLSSLGAGRCVWSRGVGKAFVGKYLSDSHAGTMCSAWIRGDSSIVKSGLQSDPRLQRPEVGGNLSASPPPMPTAPGGGGCGSKIRPPALPTKTGFIGGGAN